MKSIQVGLIGTKFMGRAHSNALAQVGHFFDLPRVPVMQIAVGRNTKELASFAARWGWRQITTRWQDLAEDDELGLIDVATPNDVHAEPAIAMLEAGKHVACEKPLAGTLKDARAMRDAAKRAKRSKTFVWFNYRRCPAVALAHQLVAEGRIGRVYHVRATYLQSWGGPATPMLWRFDKGVAGSGAHGDLNAHIVDMCRFVTGEELTEIHGAVARTFVNERTLPGTKKKAKSTVDDALLFLASLSGGGVASFEASRLAAPHQNANSLEANGSKGSLRFDFEDMNLLHFHDAARGPREGGWTRIVCTSSAGKHPYAGNWWPDAHVLGYEHGFVNMLADVLRVLGGEKPVVPLPDFEDAYQTQRVLEAALISAKERCAIQLSAVK
ncbi:MAG: Gfo/Idh/MocA family oxidoreductase [Planctomycetes bacterium]|nr:Gfo/Idh/MocA family oxidoreductase [Planctomycetota bacterium]